MDNTGGEPVLTLDKSRRRFAGTQWNRGKSDGVYTCMTSTIGAPTVPGSRLPAVTPAPHPPAEPLTPPPAEPRACPPTESNATTSVRVVVRRLPPLEPLVEPRPPATQPEPGPAHAEPPEIPGRPRIEVSTVLRLVLEILDERRPPTQLNGRRSPAVLRYLAAATGQLNPPAVRRVAALRGQHGPPGLRSLRLSHPANGVTEASAVWRYRGRPRALAARFEWTTEKWRCTALRLG
ncbi:MAG: hypothetical protein H0V92_00925 [Pseudonocardiales bacterium]|nr:hypothetical protein [Pseudonocardiales bacterium]